MPANEHAAKGCKHEFVEAGHAREKTVMINATPAINTKVAARKWDTVV